MKIQLKYLQNRTSNIRQDYIRKRYREAINHPLIDFTMRSLFHAYNPSKDLHLLRTLGQMSISTSEFCQIIGRMRLYQALTPNQQKRLPRLLLGDSQINAACRAFVSDVNFKSTGDSITGWQLLNPLNGSVKSSYIDNFLERNLNCTEFVQGIQRAKLGDSEYAWFLG